MKTLTLELELLDEVVVSERGATEGQHRSLDYLPGASLLGWAASRLYAPLGKVAAWEVFHSGKVRFGNALPIAPSGCVAWPMPLCWHENKAVAEAVSGNLIDMKKLINLLHVTPEDTVQVKQLRAGYVADTGEVVKPARMLRMKTAINPGEGRAAGAQLFGYEAICARTRFAATLQADVDIDPKHLECLKTAFTGVIRIGRSRSAQYGRVKATPADWRDATQAAEVSGELVLWLQSDLACIGFSGAPVLIPEPASLGLPEGTRYLAEKSFVRFRRYSPYNGARRSYAVERQLISQGSVLVFALPDGQPFSTATLDAGLGAYRECGLGQVRANPALLMPTPAFVPYSGASAGASAPPEKPKESEEPKDDLVTWLKARSAHANAQTDAQVWAETKIVELRRRYRDAHAYNGLSGHLPIGPGRAQWGRVEEAAKAAATAIEQALFGGNNAVCKAGDEDWSVRYGPEDADTFTCWLKNSWTDVAEKPDARYRLALLADLARKLVIRLDTGDRA